MSETTMSDPDMDKQNRLLEEQNKLLGELRSVMSEQNSILAELRDVMQKQNTIIDDLMVANSHPAVARGIQRRQALRGASTDKEQG